MDAALRGSALREQVGQAEVGGEDAAVEGERGAEGALRRLAVARPRRLVPHLRLEVAEHEAVVRLAQPAQPRLQLVGLAPLPLLLVQLLQADQGMDVPRVHGQRLAEGAGGAVEEAGLAEVGAQRRPARARAPAGSGRDRARSAWWTWIALSTWPASRSRLPSTCDDLHRVRLVAGHLGQLADGQLELARGQVVQALDVVGRGAEGGAVALLAAAQRGGPGAAGEHARDGGEQDGQQGGVGQRSARARALSRQARPDAGQQRLPVAARLAGSPPGTRGGSRAAARVRDHEGLRRAPRRGRRRGRRRARPRSGRRGR